MAQFEKLEEDKRELTLCLKQTNAAKEKVKKVVAQLQTQQKVAEQDIKTLEMQQNQLRQQLQEQIHELMLQSEIKGEMFACIWISDC